MTDTIDTNDIDDDGVEILPPDQAIDAEPVSDEGMSENDVRRLPRWSLILGAGLLMGLGLAALLAWFVRTPAFDDAALRADMRTLERQISTLQSQPAPEPVSLEPLSRRLDRLESRIENVEGRIVTLEDTADPAPIYADLVARLETLQAEGFEIPEDFVFPEMPDPVDLSGLESRMAALEAQINDLANRTWSGNIFGGIVEEPDIRPEPDIDLSSLPRFPGDQLRKAADELSGEGLIKRLWSQHVRVRGEKSPRVLIREVEANLAKDRPRAALASFDQLPPPMQSLARGWRADLEDAITRADQSAVPVPDGDMP